MKTLFFTLSELCVTDSGLPNFPGWEEIDNLYRLVTNVLDPLRAAYKQPIKVNSGFRSEAVNKAIGGVPTSQHRYGAAADITAGDRLQNKRLFDTIVASLPFDQCICEKDYTWIHVSYKASGNRKQVLFLA